MAQLRGRHGVQISFVVAVLITLLSMPRSAVAQINIPTVPKPMSLPQFETFTEVLRLSGDQSVAARRLYDQYLIEWTALCYDRQQRVRTARGVIMEMLAAIQRVKAFRFRTISTRSFSTRLRYAMRCDVTPMPSSPA